MSADPAAGGASVPEQAIAWLLAMQEAPRDGALRQSWQQWLEADPAHRSAWQQLETFRTRLSEVPTPLAHATLLPPRRATRRQVLAAATLLLGAGSVAVGRDGGPWQRLAADHHTAVGEQLTVALAPHATVQLNSGSAIDVAVAAAGPRVRLLQGEVLLQVHPADRSSSSPVTVETLGHRLLAKSSQFSVRRQAGYSSAGISRSSDYGVISVYDGDIALRTPVGADLQLHAGQACRFAAGASPTLSKADLNALAWTRGMLVVEEMALPTFLAELNRHRAGYVGCAPELATVRVTGTFPLADPDRVLHALQATLPVRITMLTRYWVRLVPANAA